ncbi:MAG: GGDEF domain-containing protein [Tepidisphaeraceae bacterium]
MVHDESAPADAAPRRRPVWPRALFAVVVLAAFLGTFAAGVYVRRWMPSTLVMSMAGMILIGVVLLLIGLTVLLSHMHLWRHPVHALDQLTREVHAGREPLETLSAFTGPLASLAGAIHDILHDLRQQKHEMARIRLEMAQRVAQRTAAVEHKYNSLQNQATRDSMTGLLNRRSYDRHLPQAFEQAVAKRADLTILMLDLDNFKFLNDTNGHAAGDEFLRDVGHVIRSTVRPIDLPFRCGGDEFVIALVETSVQGGLAVKRRLEMLLDALGRNTKLAYPPGCSIGMASISELARPTLEDLMAAADKRLYEAKSKRKSLKAPRDPGDAALLRKSA